MVRVREEEALRTLLDGADLFENLGLRNALGVVPYPRVGVQHRAHLTEGPSFDEADLLLDRLTARDAIKEVPASQPASDLVDAGTQLVGLAIQPRQESEHLRVVHQAFGVQLPGELPDAGARLHREANRSTLCDERGRAVVMDGVTGDSCRDEHQHEQEKEKAPHGSGPPAPEQSEDLHECADSAPVAADRFWNSGTSPGQMQIRHARHCGGTPVRSGGTGIRTPHRRPHGLPTTARGTPANHWCRRTRRSSTAPCGSSCCAPCSERSRDHTRDSGCAD